jgi:tetratricopeptide (TPR) repeat protein
MVSQYYFVGLPRARIFCLLLGISLLISFSTAQNSLEQLRQNIADGFYASAARIAGPSAVRENPDNPEAYFLYSYALYYAEDVAAAREQFEKARSLLNREMSPEYTHLDGLIRAAQGDLAGAITLLETAFLQSQSYEMAMDWGRSAWQAGEFDTALKAFGAASGTEEGQREIWPHLNRGRILQLVKGDTEGAIAAYNTVLDIFDANDPGGDAPVPPGVVEAHFHLGEIYEALGDNALAKSYYDSAIGLDSNYTPAKDALSRLARNP